MSNRDQLSVHDKSARDMDVEEKLVELADIMASMISWLWPANTRGEEVARGLQKRLLELKKMTHDVTGRRHSPRKYTT